MAEHYDRSNPWDIIKYNFETDVAEEVNWYLQELVGCTKSKDGSNYSFSSADNPGFIYIPPKSWKPSAGRLSLRHRPPPGGPLTADDETARRSVLNVLADPKLANIGFTYRGYTLDSADHGRESNHRPYH